MVKQLTLLLIMLFFCLRTYSSNPPTGDSKIGETNYIEFHSSYLLNLHHFAFQKGLLFRMYKNDTQKRFDTLFKEVNRKYDSKTKSSLMSAIRFYADSIAGKNMLFDTDLRRLKYILQSASYAEELKKRNVSKGIVEALEALDNFYFDNYWEKQNAINRHFLKTKLKTLKKTESYVIAQCAKYYGYKLPTKKIRVDLVDDAGFFCAYTSTDPYVSSTISSTDKRHEGTQGIEVVYHECSHAMMDSVFSTQRSVCIENNLKMDHNVWHTILFYSTGYFVKQALATIDQKHELYMNVNNFSGLNPLVKKTIELTETYWQQYLDNKISMEAAIKKIVLDPH